MTSGGEGKGVSQHQCRRKRQSLSPQLRLHGAARRMSPEWPRGFFAARAGGNQERCREQDRHRKRKGYNHDRYLHRCLIAMPGTARCRAKLRMAWKNLSLCGKWHSHRDLDRKHREGDDQAQRQRADRERSRDGVRQSGRCCGREAAIKACCAGRPFHGRKTLRTRANHPQPSIYRWNRWQFCGDAPSKMAETRRAGRVCPLHPLL